MLSPFLAVHRAGPGAAPGQADRRALGRGRAAATRWAPSRRCGRSGTTATATPYGTSGAARCRTCGTSGYRLSGSSDLYAWGGRRPYASVNFITAHDGFTLRDLVSYERKHNEANGEGNRDGTDDNRSWNCGAEGESDDAARHGAAPAAAAQPPHHAAAVHGRADAGRGRRDGAHPGRQQQRLLPGQRDRAGSTGRCCDDPGWAALLELTSRLIDAAPRATPCCAAAAFFSGRAQRRRRAAGPGLVHPARRGDDGAGLVRAAGHARHVPVRAGHPRPRRAGPTRSSTTASSPSCTPGTARAASCCRGRPGRSAYELVVDTSREDAGGGAGAVHRGGRAVITVPARSLLVLKVAE